MTLLKIHELNLPEEEFYFNKLHNNFIENIKRQDEAEIVYYVSIGRPSDSIVISNKLNTIQIENSKISTGQQYINVYDSEFKQKIHVKLDYQNPNSFNLKFSEAGLGAVISMSHLISTTLNVEKKNICLNSYNKDEMSINNKYSVRKKEDGSHVINFLGDALISKMLIPYNAKGLLIEVSYPTKALLGMHQSEIVSVKNYEEFVGKYQDLVLLSKDLKFINAEEINNVIELISKIENEKNKNIADMQNLIKKIIPNVGKLVHLVKTSTVKPDYMNRVIQEYSKNILLIENIAFFNNIEELLMTKKKINDSFNKNTKTKKLNNI